MKTSICTKCGKDLPQDMFPLCRGEHLTRCKTCSAGYKRAHYMKDKEKYLARAKAFREKNHEGYLAYLKEYTILNREELKNKRKKYKESGKARERNRENSQIYRATPEGRLKDNVRSYVAYALKIGKLIRPTTCSRCNKECKPEAHHKDYSKVLDVIWLCTRCHEYTHHLNEEQLPEGTLPKRSCK